jgi:integrase
MPRAKLTQRYIDRLRAPDPSGKPKFHWDENVPGFGVRVSGSTNQMSYVAQRDFPGGKKGPRIVIAKVGEISLEDARRKAQDKLHMIRHGIDPRIKQRGEATLEASVEAYIATHPNLAPKSQKEFRRLLSHLSDWRSLTLPEIDAEMVQRRHLEIGAEHRATANQVMRLLRAVYNQAGVKNPVRLRRQWFDVPRRTRLVKADQLASFFTAVNNLPNPVARDYLLLILFTGMRREEAARLTWDDVDFSARLMRVPASSTKAKRKLDLPLTDFVFDLLKRRRDEGDEGFVFPANSRAGHISEPKYPLGLVAEASGIEISVHDLRRTFVTAAENAEISVLAMKALVNHSLGSDVTGGYVIVTVDRLREPAQRVTDLLKRWCGIKQTQRPG